MADIPQITQIAIVVEDLQATMEAYHRTLGWGPWNVYEHRPPALHDLRLHGRPVDFGMLVAETQVGPIAFELIQPLDGPNAYREWLDAHGEGLHHIACATDSSEAGGALMERLDAAGFETVTGGRLGDRLEFRYFATLPSLKLILETGRGYPETRIEPVRVYPPQDAG